MFSRINPWIIENEITLILQIGIPHSNIIFLNFIWIFKWHVTWLGIFEFPPTAASFPAAAGRWSLRSPRPDLPDQIVSCQRGECRWTCSTIHTLDVTSFCHRNYRSPSVWSWKSIWTKNQKYPGKPAKWPSRPKFTSKVKQPERTAGGRSTWLTSTN